MPVTVTDVQADLKPGTLACHEVFQSSSLIADMIDSQLIQHPVIKANPVWLSVAIEAEDLLWALNNSIRENHLPNTMRTRAANYYVNEGFEPRACDHCGKEYRGPAIYCSLECAEADA